MSKIKLPDMLAFTGSIDPSLFGLYANVNNTLIPLELNKSSVIGTIANYMTEKEIEEARKNNKKNPANPNPKENVAVFLPLEADTLIVKGSVLFKHKTNKPSGCNQLAFVKTYTSWYNKFVELNGFDELAKRYVFNLLNGKILWRNNEGLNGKFLISVESADANFKLDGALIEDTYKNSSARLSEPNVAKLVALVSAALSGKTKLVKVDITVSITLGYGAEVYPSQEFVEGKAGKLLATHKNIDGKDVPVLHSQKVGNAIRTIDDWYADDASRMVAVSPYGVDKEYTIAHRVEHNNHFYNILKDIEDLTADMSKNSKISNRDYFIASIFVLGGVFGAKES